MSDSSVNSDLGSDPFAECCRSMPKKNVDNFHLSEKKKYLDWELKKQKAINMLYQYELYKKSDPEHTPESFIESYSYLL